jgi:hypothetical protein
MKMKNLVLIKRKKYNMTLVKTISMNYLVKPNLEQTPHKDHKQIKELRKESLKRIIKKSIHKLYHKFLILNFRKSKT